MSYTHVSYDMMRQGTAFHKQEEDSWLLDKILFIPDDVAINRPDIQRALTAYLALGASDGVGRIKVPFTDETAEAYLEVYRLAKQ